MDLISCFTILGGIALLVVLVFGLIFGLYWIDDLVNGN